MADQEPKLTPEQADLADAESVKLSLDSLETQLVNYASSTPKGRALVISKSDYTREEIVDRLGRKLKKQVAVVELKPDLTPVELARQIVDETAEVPLGSVVVVSRWNSAFPNNENLNDYLSLLGLYREAIFKRPMVHIWWMTPEYAARFRDRAPDTYSWFLMILRPREEVYRPIAETQSKTAALPAAQTTDPTSAIRTARWLRKRFNDLRKDPSLQKDPEFALELVRLLREIISVYLESGLLKNAVEFSDRAMFVKPLNGRLQMWIRSSILDPQIDEISILSNSINNLVDTFFTLGEESGRTIYLSLARDILLEVLGTVTLQSSPSDWAATQNNLGNVLQVLGELSGDVSILNASADAYRSTLEVYTRASRPFDWAIAENNLGMVLKVLGERTGNVSILNASEDAFRSALQVLTRASSTRHWAGIQNNLGNVLRVLGELSGDMSVLRGSADAYYSVLEVCSRASSPSVWAMTQNNLGTVLKALGERSGDMGALNASVNTYRSALEVYKRASSATRWAATQNNLGEVLQVIGERSGDVNALNASVNAYRAALDVYTRGSAPYLWLIIEKNLAKCLQSLQTLAPTPECEAEIAELQAQLDDYNGTDQEPTN